MLRLTDTTKYIMGECFAEDNDYNKFLTLDTKTKIKELENVLWRFTTRYEEYFDDYKEDEEAHKTIKKLIRRCKQMLNYYRIEQKKSYCQPFKINNNSI